MIAQLLMTDIILCLAMKRIFVRHMFPCMYKGVRSLSNVQVGRVGNENNIGPNKIITEL